MRAAVLLHRNKRRGDDLRRRRGVNGSINVKRSKSTRAPDNLPAGARTHEPRGRSLLRRRRHREAGGGTAVSPAVIEQQCETAGAVAAATHDPCHYFSKLISKSVALFVRQFCSHGTGHKFYNIVFKFHHLKDIEERAKF